MDPVAASPAAEWNPGPPHTAPPIAWVWLAVVVGVPAAVVGLVVFLVLGTIPAIAAVALFLGAVAAWVLAQGRLALRSAGAVRMEPGSSPRIENLVAGIASDLGLPRLALWRSHRDGPNAMICTAGGPALVLSGPVEEELTRSELEGVFTHLLLRQRREELWRGSLAAALGPAAGPVAPHVGSLEDYAAVAITRYPPALASALEKCSPVRGRFAVLWFCGTGPYQAPVADRIAALDDL